MIVDGIESRRWSCAERALFEIFEDGVSFAAPHAAHMFYGSRSALDIERRASERDRDFFDHARELHL